MNQRVYVTGMGAFTALGDTLQSTWDRLLAGDSVVEPIPQRWRQFSDFNSNFWSPLPELDFSSKGISRSELMQNDIVTLLIICAVQEALDNSQIITESVQGKRDRFRLKDIAPGRAGVIIGTGQGGVSSLLSYNAHQILRQATGEVSSKRNMLGEIPVSEFIYPRRYNPFIVSMLMPNAVSAYPGIRYGVSGMNQTVTSACASGTEAIGRAFRAIQSGDMDIVITGGTEYLYDEYGHIFRGFDSARTLAMGQSPEDINQPFDEARNGFLFSEGGAASLVLESEDSCSKREAIPIAEVLSSETTFDAYNIMQPDPSMVSAKSMLSDLLRKGGREPSDINYINAHGTGTQANDIAEAELIEHMFPHKPLVNSTKSVLGHSIGGSGAIEAAVTVMSIANNTTHVCRNLCRPILDLNFCRDVIPRSINVALSQSFAFGGHNSAVLFSSIN